MNTEPTVTMLEAQARRREVLLRAAYDLIERSLQSHYVLETASILVHYDEANCDGHCLKEDIANELGIEEGEDPIPLAPEDDEA